MSGFMYRRAIRGRNVAAALLAAALCMAGWTLAGAGRQAYYYSQAAAHQAAGELLAAEDDYRKALAASSFDYRRNEISRALETLLPVTEVLRLVATLQEEIRSAAAAGDADQLGAADSAYVRAKQAALAGDEAAKQRFIQAAQEADMEGSLERGFAAIRQAAEKQLAAGPVKGAKAAERADGDPAGDAARSLILIPPSYFGGEAAKRQKVNGLLQSYDIARLDVLAQTTPYADVWRLGEALRLRYEGWGWEAAWVVPKLEKLALGSLGIVEKEDLAKFLAAAKLVQTYTAWAGPGSKIAASIETSFAAQLKKAEALATAGKYDQAVALYQTLAAYRDTSNEMEAAQTRSLAADPARLLAKAGADGKLALVAGFKTAAGEAAAAAWSAERGQLTAALLTASGVVQRADSAKLALTPKAIKADRAYGGGEREALVVEAPGKQRKTRYIVFEWTDARLLPVLDVEADSLSPSSAKGELVAERPLLEAGGTGGNGDAPAKAYYRYQKERYALTRTEPSADSPGGGQAPGGNGGDRGAGGGGGSGPAAGTNAGAATGGSDAVRAVQPQELAKVASGAVVRLETTIVQGGINQALAQTGDVTVVLTGSLRFQPGAVLVTGVYRGSEPRRTAGEGAAAGEAYRIEVTELLRKTTPPRSSAER